MNLGQKAFLKNATQNYFIMLNVFAIEPKIGRDLDQFRYCTEHCHPLQGRLIADLPPGGWSVETAECIDQLDNLRPVKRKQLKRTLEKVRAQLVDRPGTNWDYLESSWVTNAENEHRREPFSLIVSPDYDEADDENRKYPPSELNNEVSAWNTPNGVQIKRSPGEFAKAILPMLRLAREIHFVDRFFNVKAGSLYTENYRQIIEDLAKYHNPFYSFPSLVIHCCPNDKKVPTSDYFKDDLNKHYAPLIPQGKSIKVFLWETEITPPRGAHPFHNRYVLSNHCGVMAGYGTDSSKDETDASDTLVILPENAYKEIWRIRKKKWPGASIKEEFTIPEK